MRGSIIKRKLIMEKYIWINRGEIGDAAETVEVEGVNLEVHLSLMDTPVSVAGEMDKSAGEFVVAFRYSVPEPPASKPVIFGKDVQVIEGRHTGKILELRIPVNADRPTVISLQTQIDDALNDRQKQEFESLSLETAGRRLNQKVARKVLSDRIGELIPSA